MKLSDIKRSRLQDVPLRILVYGVEGVGKSTLASGAPEPVFIGPEDGAPHLDVAHFPTPKDWDQIVACLRALTETHPYKTVVIDTVDWIEPLLHAHVCQQGGMASIEDFGYGKGYVKALELWRHLVQMLEALRFRGMHIILVGHASIKAFRNPEGDDYDRYTLKIHEKAGGLLREWCDAVLFATYETYVDKDSKTKRARGISSGNRILQTERRAAYDAKNRYNLPDSISLGWDELWAAIQSGKPGNAIKRIDELLLTIGDAEIEAKARGYLAANPGQYAPMINRLQKIAEERCRQENTGQ